MKGIFDMLAGFAAGIISGFGIGGGTLLVIYLTLFAGYSQTAAQGLNLLYFLPTAAAAVYSHVKNRLVDKESAVFAAVSGVFSAVPAAFLASSVDTALLKRLFGLLIIYVGLIEIFGKSKRSRPKEKGGEYGGNSGI